MRKVLLQQFNVPVTGYYNTLTVTLAAPEIYGSEYVSVEIFVFRREPAIHKHPLRWTMTRVSRR